MQTVFLDYESYYNKKDRYDLGSKDMSLTRYLHDERFKAWGAGIKIGGEATEWLPECMLDMVFQQIDWNNTMLVAHNCKFDGSILAWKYGIKPRIYMDTQLLSKAIIGSAIPKHSLKVVGEYLGTPPKGELKIDGLEELTPEQEKELGDYCIKDVDICYSIFNKLYPQLPKGQIDLIDWSIRCFIEPEFKVDTKLAKELFDGLHKKKENLFKKLGIDKKVFASNPQFADLLNKEGYAVAMKANPKGKMIPAVATKDSPFIDMLKSNDARLVELCEARVEAKQSMEVKRIEHLIDLGTTRYPFDIIYSGADQTHRFSGGSGGGGNPQQFKKDGYMRNCIIADQGYLFGNWDYSQIEFRILAYLANEKAFIDGIESGADIYCQFASKIYGRPITKKDVEARKFGKAAILGLGYGMGARRFKEAVKQQTGRDITEKYSKEVVQLYRKTYPAIPRFWKLCDSVIQTLLNVDTYPPSYFPGFKGIGIRKEELILPSGLQIKYYNLDFDLDEKNRKQWYFKKYVKGQLKKVNIWGGFITENICQALAGEIVKEAIIKLRDKGFVAKGQLHDALMFSIPKSKVEEAQKIIPSIMTTNPTWFPNIKLEVEGKIGDNWGEC